MNKIKKFEAWARKTYNPIEASWKRPTLLILSIVILIACAIADYTQINYQWTNNGVWLVIVFFDVFSAIGFFVSVRCKDFWVALALGNTKL